MKLDYLQALKRVSDARGAWVLHGQEPLLEQNLMDAFRASWQQREVERQRYDVSSVSDWKNVFNALNSLSLFSTQLAVEVHGNIKPDASGIKLLKSYLQQDSDNLLLIIMPKQDSSSLKSSFFQVMDANGVNVSLTANYPRDRQQILSVEAEKLGIKLANDAWVWLEQHHEHNLLAAKNSLMRVSDTFAEIDVIQVDHLYACL
jgi:DNA polymerase-3 subunit delta